MARPRGPKPGWMPDPDNPKQARQAAILSDIVAMYDRHRREDTLPRGGRGIFYDLRPNGLVTHGWVYVKPTKMHPITLTKDSPAGAVPFAENEIHPTAVQEVLVMARRAGIILEHWVADGRMPDSIGSHYDKSVEDTAETVSGMVLHAPEDYKLNPQRFQSFHIEVLCEAADLQPRLARIANPYGVTVYSGSGYDGLKGKRQMAERALKRDKPTIVLHVGDRDDHGERIYIAVGEDVVAWAKRRGHVLPVGVGLGMLLAGLEGHDVGPSAWFARLGLTADQADDLDILDADGKAEVDAVPVRVMDGWLTDAIEEIQTDEARERHLAEEAKDREQLPDAIRAKLDAK